MFGIYDMAHPEQVAQPRLDSVAMMQRRGHLHWIADRQDEHRRDTGLLENVRPKSCQAANARILDDEWTRCIIFALEG